MKFLNCDFCHSLMMLSLITVVPDITAGYRTGTGTALQLLTTMRPVRLIFED